MKKSTFALILLIMATQCSLSQGVPQESPGPFNRVGRWSLGLHGGANMWMSDFDKRHISGAGDLFLRYSLSRYFSLGLMGGYDCLQAYSTETPRPSGFTGAETYVETKGFTGDAVAWFHFNAGKKVSPYFYAGVGTYMYKRKLAGGKFWPEDKNYQTLHIPVGLGIEVAFSKHVALDLNVGARILDNATDNWAGAKHNMLGTDWYPTARAGLNFYFGSSKDDDNDSDLLTNGYEKTIGTDPNKADTDGDGISDRDEVVRFHTDPLKADSDGDGLKDGEEGNTYRTEPLKADTDGDGLKDGQEVNTYRTDPLKADTDGDGLKDGDEVNTYRTDPLKADTDGDGLKDGDEVNMYHTDPLKADTDGGSVNDGAEVARGSSPLDPNDDVLKKEEIKVEVGKAIVLDGIVFDSGKSKIKPNAETILGLAYNTLAQNPDIAVEIRGYTDNVGSKAKNIKLSDDRAKSVKNWLIQQGVAADRVTSKGYGPANPIGSNKTAAGRQMNRRIEFFRTK
jgi:outer membrane protein OmpA-like peptidoglycan-associated protein